MSGAASRPLWTCPECGRAFANRNQQHACGRHSLEAHFAGRDPRIRALFDAFLARIHEIGPVTVLPEKTRIAFQTRMSFAQLSPGRAWVDGHLVLARRVEHPVFRRIDTISQRNHVHHFRLADEADITPDLLGFLREAYDVGEQKHLAR
ncbi:MAG TPA: DUF5655 domain-containing protein [Longimicrobium sp.]|nr:DUF5655 domain-containing protein [Longimicrobium sp.]